MYTLLYFSPTGNTKHLAELLAKNLNMDSTRVLPLEFLDPESLMENKNIILMFSIHGFNAPRTVKRFVKNMPIGINKNIHIIAVGCNESWVNDAVSSDIRKILKSKKYNIKVDIVLAVPLTFVMAFPKDAGSSIVIESEKKLFDISKQIIQNVKSDRKVKSKSKVIHFIGKAENPAARMFGLELHATKSCDSCSICWNRCPENNIKPNKNNHPSFGFSCEMCMRCLTECPQNAITPYISKFMLIKDGYSLEKYLAKINK